MKFNVIGRSIYGKLQYQNSNIERRKCNYFNAWKLLCPLKGYLRKTLSLFDDVVGFSQVIEAQSLVLKYEQQFENARNKVHSIKQIMEEKQDLLNEMRHKLDRCDRHNESYLLLVADEHKLLLNTKHLHHEFDSAEQQERQLFRLYSGAVRLSHERERLNGERTKYWSLIASVGGTILGFTFSSLITHNRLEGMSSITQSAISQVLLEMQTNFKDHQTAIISQIHSLNEAIMKIDSGIFSDKHGSEVIEIFENKLEEACRFLKVFYENAQRLPVSNEKFLKDLPEDILNCILHNKEFMELKTKIFLFEKHLGINDETTEKTNADLLQEKNEKIHNSNLKSYEMKKNVDIASGHVNDSLNSKSFNVLLVFSTLAFVAVSYWKDLF